MVRLPIILRRRLFPLMKMKTPVLLLTVLLSGLAAAAEPQMLFFAKESAKESTRIALTIDGDKVTGTQVWQPKEGHGSRGFLDGIITGGGIIQVLHQYEIEGSEQSEEEVLKLDGDKLYIGQGELVDGGNNRMNLKEPNKVGFPTFLTKVKVIEPKAGTPERKAIMDAMRVEVNEHAGKPVTFTGSVLISGAWARFQGSVAPTDGKPPENPSAAADLELDFFALLNKNADGKWQIKHWGFAGDSSVSLEARDTFPKASWVLFE